MGEAKENVWQMEHHPGQSFKCGPYALASLLAMQNPQAADNPLIEKAESTPEGFSMAEVAELSRQVHLNYRAAKRAPGAEIIIPSVIHWKSGHYAAIVAKNATGYLVKDPTFGGDMEIKPEVIKEEGSGYFLIPSGKLPHGWLLASAAEISTIRGRGTITSWMATSTSVYDKTIHGSCCPCKGMATYDAFTMLASLDVSDTPVGYVPAAGPAIPFTVSYHQLEATQPANLTYSNFGSLWVHNWMAFLTVPATVGAAVTVNLPGGGQETYSTYTSTGTNQGYYPIPQVKGQGLLYVIATTDYERRLPDGSKEVYSMTPDGAGRIFLTQVVDRYNNAVTLKYDVNERLVSITDAVGRVTTLSYGLTSDKYKITEVTDPFGRSASFTYNASSPAQLVRITDVIGLTSQFTYGTSNAMTALTTPYGVTSFAYTDNGNTRALQMTDPLGAAERVESWMNATGKLAMSDPSTTVPYPGMSLTNNYLVYRNSFYWDKVAMAEAPGDYTKAHLFHWLHSSPSSLVATGILESEKAALENRVWYDYQGQGSTISAGALDKPTTIGRVLDDGTQQIAHIAYEPRSSGYGGESQGLPSETIDPLRRQTRWAYASNFQDVTQVTLGPYYWGEVPIATITYYPTPEYPPHLPQTIADNNNQKTSFTYNARGQILTVTDPLLHVTTYAYDSDGDLTSIVGPAGDTWTLTYDGYGRVRTTTSPEDYVLTTSYDALDRITSVAYPDGTSTSNTYNRLDLASVKDRNGNLTTYGYDADRHLTSVKDANGHVTSFVWCMCGELNSMIDPNNHTTTWTRDVMGRVTVKTFADGTKVLNTYENTTSRLASTTDAKGQVTAYTYFEDNHLKQVTTTSTSGTITASFTYDPNFDRLTSMTDGTGTTTWSYNSYNLLGYWPPRSLTTGAGQVGSIVGPLANSTIAFTYDPLGRELTHSINGTANTSTLAYDALGRITTLTNPLGTFTPTYVSGVSPRLASMLYPNGQKTAYSYFPTTGDLRLQQIDNLSSSSAVLSKFAYTYDSEGNIKEWTRQSGTATPDQLTPSYDLAYQLTGASDTNASTGAVLNKYGYSYDPGANRTSEQINSSTTTAVFNTVNELTKQTVGTTSKTLSYDLNGNLLSDGINSYAWDARNRLVGIDYSTGASTQLTYDGLDRCVKIVELSPTDTVNATRQFIWIGLNRAEERNASNAVVKRFYPQGEQISGMNYFFTRDHLGSVREMTNASGSLVARYAYDPYGRRTLTSGSDGSDFGFTGHFFHQPSSLHLAPFRAYSANLGRWLSRDPIGESGGVNLYEYVEGKPLTNIDPLGWQDTGILNSNSKAQSLCPEGSSPLLLSNGLSVYNPFRHQTTLYMPSDVSLQENIEFGESLADLPIDLKNSIMLGYFRPGGPMDYQRLYSLDGEHINKAYIAFGNYNYGVVAAAAGYSLEAALTAAGIINARRWRNDWSGPDLNRPENAYFIRAGYDDYISGQLLDIEQ